MQAVLYREEKVEDDEIFIATCVADGTENGALKVASRVLYSALFDIDFHGIYHRFPGTLFHQLFPQSKNYRDCGEVELTSTTIEGTGSVSAKLPVWLLNFEGAVNTKKMLERSRKLGGETFSFYSAYAYGSRQRRGELYTIEMIANCDGANLSPEKPYMVAIDYPSRQLEEIRLHLSDITKSFESVDSLFNYRSTAVNLLRSGQFFVIQDSMQYLRLRDVLMSSIAPRGFVNPLLKNEHNDLEYIRVVQFLTHLVMAATVRFAPGATPGLFPSPALHSKFIRSQPDVLVYEPLLTGLSPAP